MRFKIEPKFDIYSFANHVIYDKPQFSTSEACVVK